MDFRDYGIYSHNILHLESLLFEIFRISHSVRFRDFHISYPGALGSRKNCAILSKLRQDIRRKSKPEFESQQLRSKIAFSHVNGARIRELSVLTKTYFSSSQSPSNETSKNNHKNKRSGLFSLKWFLKLTLTLNVIKVFLLTFFSNDMLSGM